MLIMSSNYRVTQPVTRILKDTKPTKKTWNKKPTLALQEIKKGHIKKKERKK